MDTQGAEEAWTAIQTALQEFDDALGGFIGAMKRSLGMKPAEIQPMVARVAAWEEMVRDLVQRYGVGELTEHVDAEALVAISMLKMALTKSTHL
jgi:hypothetical protein